MPSKKSLSQNAAASTAINTVLESMNNTNTMTGMSMTVLLLSLLQQWTTYSHTLLAQHWVNLQVLLKECKQVEITLQ